MTASVRRLVCVVALVAAWAVFDAQAEACAGVLHLLPALLLFAPLLLGRYPGEERLASLRSRRTARPVRAPVLVGGWTRGPLITGHLTTWTPTRGCRPPPS